MRTSLKIAGAASALLMSAGLALPAFAHHVDEHAKADGTPYAGCATPPPERSGVAYESAFTIWAGSNTSEGITTGYRTRDIYAYTAVSAQRGAKIAVFQPWWDANGPTQGPHWVDVAISVGPSGPSVCNKSRTTG